MTRALLRTRTGCQRCKKRRKKCDEVRPICSACRRWGFECLWPEQSKNMADSEVELAQPQRDLVVNIQRPLTGHGFTSFRDQTQLSLLQGFTGIYQSFICPLAGAEYADLSPFVTVALDQAWSRDALNAFTGYMMFARSADKRLEQPALELYQSAVLSLSEKVKHPLCQTEIVSVMMTATFLGLLEGLGTGSASHVIAHFSFVAQLGRKCFADPVWNTFLLPLKRIILEDIIYNLACMSIFCPVSETALDAINCLEYGRVFGGAASNKSLYQLSPHFGGNYEFYQLILEVTHVGRQELSQTVRDHHATKWFARLDILESRLHHYYRSAPKRAAHMYVAKYQLHAAALRIFCLKVQDHSLLPSAPEVKQHVQKAEQIFSRNALQENHNPSLAWPLIVLLCACADSAMLDFFTRQIDTIKLNFGRGHFHNLEAVQERLKRSFELTDELSPCAKLDNLGLLLLEGGILSINNESPVTAHTYRPLNLPSHNGGCRKVGRRELDLPAQDKHDDFHVGDSLTVDDVPYFAWSHTTGQGQEDLDVSYDRDEQGYVIGELYDAPILQQSSSRGPTAALSTQLSLH